MKQGKFEGASNVDWPVLTAPSPRKGINGFVASLPRVKAKLEGDVSTVEEISLLGEGMRLVNFTMPPLADRIDRRELLVAIFPVRTFFSVWPPTQHHDQAGLHAI